MLLPIFTLQLLIVRIS